VWEATRAVRAAEDKRPPPPSINYSPLGIITRNEAKEISSFAGRKKGVASRSGCCCWVNKTQRERTAVGDRRVCGLDLICMPPARKSLARRQQRKSKSKKKPIQGLRKVVLCGNQRRPLKGEKQSRLITWNMHEGAHRREKERETPSREKSEKWGQKRRKFTQVGEFIAFRSSSVTSRLISPLASKQTQTITLEIK
jgi:hypothetical protein